MNPARTRDLSGTPWFRHISISLDSVEFAYLPGETSQGIIHRPFLPIVLSNGDREFFVNPALVDTGADITLLPMEIAHQLGVVLDDTKPINVDSAGGGYCVALPSLHPITYVLKKKGHRPIRWTGIAYFAPRQPIVLLGQYQCLEKLTLTFDGPGRQVRVEKK